MNKMKYGYHSLLFLVLIGNAYCGNLEQSKIVPKFYQILMNMAKTSAQDETDFFGGRECDSLRQILLTKEAYSKSITPIWDFIKDNKDFFITKNLLNLNDAKVHCSNPFENTRLWNNSTDDRKKVYVLFPTEMVKLGKKGSHGRSTLLFTLGSGCYIDIEETLKAEISSTFLDVCLPTQN